MQKKIYSLFLVPCSLVLCLAVGLLMSCGDDTAEPAATPSSSSGGGYTQPPSYDKPNVFIEDIDTATFIGWRLKVKGKVRLQVDGTDPTVIRKITVTLQNLQSGRAVNIPLNTTDFGNEFDLLQSNSQGDGYDFSSDCELSRGRVQIKVDVYLSNNNSDTQSDKHGESEPFEKVVENCRNDFTINTSVEPSGSGTVTLNPPGPYSKNQTVTATATPAGSYSFLNWTDDGFVLDCPNPCTLTMDNSKNIRANFVENFTLVKDDNASKNYTAGQNILDVVQFTGRDFVAIGNARITEYFLSENGNVEQRSHDPAAMGPLPTTLSASQFTPANNKDEEEIGYTVNYYFLVKTTSSGGWRTWYLMHARGDGSCTTASNPRCTAVTVWKVP
ncbi:MAG: hypothetical protein FWF67_03450 [Fibromonadales bacterium]|nr:hypothetical protein [Fibromonadales bacterium]